jgi:hypothetical protein
MTSKRFQLFALTGAMLASASASMAGPILGALEDAPGNTGFERNGDFNDIIFQLTGDVSVNAPGGVWSSLTPKVVNEKGSVFWDNRSEDGPHMNIGYCLLGGAVCSPAGSLGGNYDYLATPSGGIVNGVSFDAAGTVTLTVLGGVTGTPRNTLGWYDLDSPGMLYSLFSVPADSAGETASFTPDGAFALFSANGGGQVYTSISSSNVDESPTQQHFAFFIVPAINGVPEPSTAATLGFGVALLGLGAFMRRKEN